MPDLPGWDSLEAVTRYHRWAEVIGIVVLALLVVSEVAAYRYGQRKDDLTVRQQEASDKRHDEEMARLHADTEASKAEIAKANARAAEAELQLEELRRRVGARRIVNEPKFIEGLAGAGPANVSIEFSEDAQDGYWLGGQIQELLQKADWPTSFRKLSRDARVFRVPPAVSSVGNAAGITLFAAPYPAGTDSAYGRAVSSLLHALNAELGAIGSQGDSSLKLGDIRLVIFPKL